jgi:cob(I)alamin adenosyltransferase
MAKIYTKTGDKGETSLLGGSRVPKTHDRIEAYGTIDELNAHIGMMISLCKWPEVESFLASIQSELFVLGSHLANESEGMKKYLPDFNENLIPLMETEIDRMDQHLEKLTHFILPGGSTAIACCHICRTVARRAERRILSAAIEGPYAEHCHRFLNRLSDYFFVLARYVAKQEQVSEVLWLNKKL